MGCTVVSAVPFAIKNIHKPGLVPAYFDIKPADEETQVLAIPEGKRAIYLVDQDKWQELDESWQDLFAVPDKD